MERIIVFMIKALNYLGLNSLRLKLEEFQKRAAIDRLKYELSFFGLDLREYSDDELFAAVNHLASACDLHGVTCEQAVESLNAFNQSQDIT